LPGALLASDRAALAVYRRGVCCQHPGCRPVRDRPRTFMKGLTMAKSMDKKKEDKKPAQKTAKEKKAAKLEKKKGK
jgi:hypothetical protein